MATNKNVFDVNSNMEMKFHVVPLYSDSLQNSETKLGANDNKEKQRFERQ